MQDFRAGGFESAGIPPEHATGFCKAMSVCHYDNVSFSLIEEV